MKKGTLTFTFPDGSEAKMEIPEEELRETYRAAHLRGGIIVTPTIKEEAAHVTVDDSAEEQTLKQGLRPTRPKVSDPERVTRTKRPGKSSTERDSGGKGKGRGRSKA